VTENPFESIESAQEYVQLLHEALDEAQTAIQRDIVSANQSQAADRGLDALRLVDYKLTQLRQHLTASSRLLNDLRMLRRLLRAERDQPPPDSAHGV
jgi:hypothetical protein